MRRLPKGSLKGQKKEGWRWSTLALKLLQWTEGPVPESLALPVEGAFLQGVDVADEEDAQEGDHGAKDEARVLDEHILVNHGPRIEEHDFDIEQDEKHRDQVELHRQTVAAFTYGEHAALIGDVLGGVALAAGAEEIRCGQHAHGKTDGDEAQNQNRNILV